MIVLIINILLLCVTLVGAWFGGTFLKLDPKIVIGAMIVIALVWIVIYLLVRMLAVRKSTTIADSLHKTAPQSPTVGSSPQQLAAMQEQFDRYLQALRASPNGKAALATLPWYLVIGAPGSGKTTALQESGLAFSSMGHGLRSVRGIGGTRNCDWWFTDQAILLDTAGRYTTQPEDQSEWFSFLDLIRQTRKGHPLNGIIVVVSTAELLKSHEAAIPVMVRPIRERIAEVSARLKLVLPVYVVFSKADLIGGFKDFFTGMSRTERDQVWGSTLTAADLAGKQPSETFNAHMAQLYTRIQTYRMQALSIERPLAQRAKICMFPQNFVVAQKWLGDFIGELFRPTPVPDQPVFRGFYLTSGIQNTKLTEVQAAPTAAAPVAPPREVTRPGTEMSIFFDNEVAQAQAGAPADQRNGFFLKDLFTRVIIPDHSLAGLPSRLVRRTHLVRMAIIGFSLAVGLIFVVVLFSEYLANRRLIEPANQAVTLALPTLKLSDRDPKTLPKQLEALDSLRQALITIRQQGHGAGGRQLTAELDGVYSTLLKNVFITPASEQIRARMEVLRNQKDKTPALYDELYDLYRCYQILADTPALDGQPLPKVEQVRLARVLTEKPLWTVRLVAPDGQISAENAKLARNQLDYFILAMPTMPGWQIHLDDTLAKSVTDALGDVMWLQRSYADLLEGAQTAGDAVGKEALLSGVNTDMLVSDYQFSPVFTKEGWGRMKSAIDEKASLLIVRYQNLHINQSVAKVNKGLRSQYVREYSNHWLHLLGSLRPRPFTSISEATTRLPVLSGPDSPYKGLLKQLGTANNSEFEDLDTNIRMPSEGKWLQDGLGAMVELQTALEKYLTTTEANSRMRDLTKLKELCTASDSVAAKFAAATQNIENDTAREAATSCLMNILYAVQAAVSTELCKEADALWSKQVAIPFNDTCAGKFPFDMESKNETDMVAFAKLFNPKNGQLNAVVQTLQELHTYRFAGKEFLAFAWDYQRLIAQLPVLREGLFATNTDKVAITFTITLLQREGEKDVTIAIGAQTFGLWQRPDRKTTFEWTQENTSGNKLSIQLASGQWLNHDYPSPGWGILRMLREGKPASRAEGGHLCTWNFKDEGLGKSFIANLIVEQPAIEAMTAGDFFRTFVVPMRASR